MSKTHRTTRTAYRGATVALCALFLFAPVGHTEDSRGNSNPRQGLTRIAMGRFLHDRWTLSLYTKPAEDGTWYCEDWNGVKESGYGCSHIDGPVRGIFPGSGYAWSEHGNMVMHDGHVSKSVKSLSFKMRNGPDFPVTIIKPPAKLDFPWNYYIAFVPIELRGERIARDASGDILATRPLYRGPVPGEDTEQTEWRSERP